eukprot:TRINITY_DN5837_c0_g1_i2.p1 TRINITY_DN5837_c0_g1~~TRINITY_DN5837_c0_g1_i2.p1  ORF type:complete len:644 (-),score=84.14 TRINITY_DN5837_c0_g1_i2:198-2129(-)
MLCLQFVDNDKGEVQEWWYSQAELDITSASPRFVIHPDNEALQASQDKIVSCAIEYESKLAVVYARDMLHNTIRTLLKQRHQVSSLLPAENEATRNLEPYATLDYVLGTLFAGRQDTLMQYLQLASTTVLLLPFYHFLTRAPNYRLMESSDLKTPQISNTLAHGALNSLLQRCATDSHRDESAAKLLGFLHETAIEHLNAAFSEPEADASFDDCLPCAARFTIEKHQVTRLDLPGPNGGFLVLSNSHANRLRDQTFFVYADPQLTQFIGQIHHDAKLGCVYTSTSRVYVLCEYMHNDMITVSPVNPSANNKLDVLSVPPALISWNGDDAMSLSKASNPAFVYWLIDALLYVIPAAQHAHTLPITTAVTATDDVAMPAAALTSNTMESDSDMPMTDAPYPHIGCHNAANRNQNIAMFKILASAMQCTEMTAATATLSLPVVTWTHVLLNALARNSVPQEEKETLQSILLELTMWLHSRIEEIDTNVRISAYSRAQVGLLISIAQLVVDGVFDKDRHGSVKDEEEEEKKGGSNLLELNINAQSDKGKQKVGSLATDSQSEAAQEPESDSGRKLRNHLFGVYAQTSGQWHHLISFALILRHFEDNLKPLPQPFVHNLIGACDSVHSSPHPVFSKWRSKAPGDCTSF